MRWFRRVLGDAGASAVEYALIIAAVAALLVPAAFAITDMLDEIFHQNCEQTAAQNGSVDPSGDCE